MIPVLCLLRDKNEFPEVFKFATERKLRVESPKSDKELSALVPAGESPVLLFIDTEILGLAKSETLERINNRKNIVLAVISARQSKEENVQFLKVTDRIDHLIAYKNQTIDEDLKKILDAFSQRSSQGNMDGACLDSLLQRLKDRQTVTLMNSQDRWECYEKLGKFVEGLSCFPEFPNIVRTAASELITNAFYDAPRDPKVGKPIQPDRRKEVNLIPPREIEFTYGIEGEYLWLLVRDPFGSLNKKTLINALFRAVTERTPKMDESSGGAGLGLLMVYEWASELFFGLAEGESTMVGCKFRITRRNRIFDAELASLHICVKP